MKNYLFIALFLLVAMSAGAQVPLDSFYSNGARWTNWYLFNTGHYTGSIKVYVNFIAGDTVVGEKKYHLYYYAMKGSKHQTTEGIPYPWVAAKVDTSRKLAGGIRVEGERVWFTKLPPDSLVQETLLYDYNLKIGDTLAWKPNANVVVDIDSVQLANGHYEKRFYFSKHSVFPDYWIRGVGSVFSSAHHKTFPGFGIDLTRSVCYEHPALGFKFYETSGLDTGTVNTCFYFAPTSVEQLNERQHLLMIYPNPVSGDNMSLVATNDIDEITIADMLGRTVMRVNDLGTGTQIFTAPSVPGMYILTATTTHGARISLRFQKL